MQDFKATLVTEYASGAVKLMPLPINLHLTLPSKIPGFLSSLNLFGLKSLSHENKERPRERKKILLGWTREAVRSGFEQKPSASKH